jgi:hypothetical protein
LARGGGGHLTADAAQAARSGSDWRAGVVGGVALRLLLEVPEDLLDHRSFEDRRHELLQLARKPPATTGSLWPGGSVRSCAR